MDETSPKPFVFVLMPFSSEFTDTYEVGIKPACRDAGAYCERVDEQIFLESILERVYNQIAKADIIIAEMTGRNPNVFYEVGYAHALNKIVILLTRNSDDIPFDLKHYPHIVYEGSITNLKSQLESRVNWCIKNPKKSQSTNEFSLKLYLNGELYREEMRVNANRVDSNLFATIKLDFHNAGNRIFEEKCEIGIIIPEDFDIRYSTQHDIVNLPDKKNLCSLGSFHEILPNAWQSFTFHIDKEHLDFELESLQDAERNNFFMSYSITVRIFTAFGTKEIPHATGCSGGACHHSAKASRGKDLQIEEPIVCRYSSAFHFQPTWTSVLGPTLIGDEVVEVGQPRETRLWTATGMMEPFHREQLPLDGVVGLIQEGAGDGPLRVCEDRLPARFRVLKPLAHPVAVGLPCGVGDMLGNVTSPLAQGKHPPALPRSHAVQHGMKRRAQRLAHRGRDRRQLLRELMDRLAQAVAQARSWEERTHPLGGAVEAIGAAPPDPLRRLRLGRRALTRLIRPGQGGRTGLRRLAQMPEDAAAGDRGHIDLVGQTAAVLFIDQARAGQGQATPGEHRHQTRVAERTDQAIDGHGGAMAEHGTPCHTQATVRGQHGIAGDLRSPLALAQDDMWEDGAHRCACRALETPDRDATQTDTPIMRMTRQALSPITGRLVWELKAEDQEAGEHPFDTRLAVFDQAAGGRFVSKITGDGAVFSRRFGRCAHGLPRCHQVSCADGTRCGSHVDISRPS